MRTETSDIVSLERIHGDFYYETASAMLECLSRVPDSIEAMAVIDLVKARLQLMIAIAERPMRAGQEKAFNPVMDHGDRLPLRSTPGIESAGGVAQTENPV